MTVFVLCSGYFLVSYGKIEALETPELYEREAYLSFWHDDISRYGGFTSYQRFIETMKSLAPADQHLAAHMFAESLFNIEGEGSIAVCDDKFNLGCFHEVFAKILTENGVGDLGRLFRICGPREAQSAGSCRHGIGHGVMAAGAYDVKHLNEALVLCDKDFDAALNKPCYDGVFMEYNLRQIRREEFNRRPFEGSWWAPCDAVESRLVQDCMFRLPQWWLYEVLKGVPLEEAFAMLGKRCYSESPSKEVRSSCFSAVGKLALQEAHYNPSKTIELCAHAAQALDDRVGCHRMAAYLVSGENGGISDAQMICRALGSSLDPWCYRRAGKDVFVRSENEINPEKL